MTWSHEVKNHLCCSNAELNWVRAGDVQSGDTERKEVDTVSLDTEDGRERGKEQHGAPGVTEFALIPFMKRVARE